MTHPLFKDEFAIVARQYTQYAYPEPIADMAAWVGAGKRYALDIELSAHLFWPRAPRRTGLNILVAGCGTNQAAYYALQNPECTVIGIDLSETSLGHEKYLKEKHGLTNLRLIWGSLLDVPALNEQFDLIVCTGVLHHLPDPGAGLRALKAVLKPDGVMGLMLYGKSLRTGVYLLQEAFQRLGLEQRTEDIRLVREILAALPPYHMVRAYMHGAEDLVHDAGIVDTFLHRVDRAYSISDVMDFVRGNGLEFMRWVQPVFYDPRANLPANHPALPRLLNLPLEEQWQVTDLLLQKMGKHEFIVAHPAHVAANRLDFDSDEAVFIVPQPAPNLQILEPGTRENGMVATCKIANINFKIPPLGVVMAKAVDGRRTLGEIAQALHAESPAVEWLREARSFFAGMNRIGAFTFRIRA